MAKFNLTGSKTVAELKKEFNEAFGSRIKVYNGGSVADDNETLGNLGLKEDAVFECRSSRTAASFIDSMKELGLKVTIWTRDYNVKVLDGLTLKSTGEIKNMATKKDMEDKIAYQREESEQPEIENDINISGMFTKFEFEDMHAGRRSFEESEIIELYKSGQSDLLIKILNNMIYDLHNEIDDIMCEEDVEINYEKGNGALYTNNLVIDEDSYFGWKFDFPCTFLVVTEGKVTDKIVIKEAPESLCGYLYVDIPYDYDIDRVKSRLEDEDCEWLEDDMIRLINRTEEDNEWEHSYEIGDCGDGLYVSDKDSYMYTVVLDGEEVYSLDF